MSREKREPEYPPDLETHFILRMPEEPAKQLRDVLKSGENLKNRLTIQIENDMRTGEVRFDSWLMNAKIVDLPTITESLKTIDNKSFYKCADICQMMICKLELDNPAEEEPDKRKKKDPYKVDKKFLYPHGIAPPTKNVRKRRFRKTLRKKCVDAPEIEKEVKRLLRADQEAVSVTWEVVQEDDEFKKSEPSTSASKSTTARQEKKSKAEKLKQEKTKTATKEPSNVVDIFGGAVSDSEEEDNINNMEMEDSRLSAYDTRLSDTNSMLGTDPIGRREHMPIEFASEMFQAPEEYTLQASTNAAHTETSGILEPRSSDLSFDDEPYFVHRDMSQDDMPPRIEQLRTLQASTSAAHTETSGILEPRSSDLSFDDEPYFVPRDMSQDDMQPRIEQLRTELEELKQRKHRTQQEIAGMENLALLQRFKDNLHSLNQEIMYKEMEYQGMLVLQNSDDI